MVIKFSLKNFLGLDINNCALSQGATTEQQQSVGTLCFTSGFNHKRSLKETLH